MYIYSSNVKCVHINMTDTRKAIKPASKTQSAVILASLGYRTCSILFASTIYTNTVSEVKLTSQKLFDESTNEPPGYPLALQRAFAHLPFEAPLY